MPPLIAVRKTVEELPCSRIAAQRLCEVRWDGDLARCSVKLNAYIDLVAGGNTGGLSMFGAEREPEFTTIGCNGGPVGVGSYLDGDSGALAPPRPATTSGGTWMPVAVLPAKWTVQRNFITRPPLEAYRS